MNKPPIHCKKKASETLAIAQGRDGQKIFGCARLFSAPPAPTLKIFFWVGAYFINFFNEKYVFSIEIMI